jgi:hypothetical protein
VCVCVCVRAPACMRVCLCVWPILNIQDDVCSVPSKFCVTDSHSTYYSLLSSTGIVSIALQWSVLSIIDRKPVADLIVYSLCKNITHGYSRIRE